MTSVLGDKSELFESILRSLSVRAFGFVVAHGVRDLNAFLELDPDAFTGVSPDVVAELLSAQEMGRQRAGGQPEKLTSLSKDVSAPEPAQPNTELVPACEILFLDGEDDSQLFQIVLDSLTTRGRSVIYHKSVRDLESFLSIEQHEPGRPLQLW